MNTEDEKWIMKPKHIRNKRLRMLFGMIVSFGLVFFPLLTRKQHLGANELPMFSGPPEVYFLSLNMQTDIIYRTIDLLFVFFIGVLWFQILSIMVVQHQIATAISQFIAANSILVLTYFTSNYYDLDFEEYEFAVGFYCLIITVVTLFILAGNNVIESYRTQVKMTQWSGVSNETIKD